MSPPKVETLDDLQKARESAPCRYCGGIFRLVKTDEYEWALRCDRCGLQSRGFDCGEGEEEQTEHLCRGDV